MKVTKRQLRRIIKEEKAKLLSEGHPLTTAQRTLLGELRDGGMSDTEILEYILMRADPESVLEALYQLREGPGSAPPRRR
jgi:hypothetical protein